MTKPNPRVGLVICYDYLFESEKRKGREEGRKPRPSAVIVAPASKSENTVLVCAITHTEPDDERDGILISPADRVWMGLDDEPQWIVTDECNLVDWSDAGIVPVPETGDWTYGTMTTELGQEAQTSALKNLDDNRLTIINRLPD